MSTKYTAASLDQKILKLEMRKAREWEELQEQFQLTKESLKPVNLIKDTFHDFTSAPDFKKNLVGSVAGLASGYVSRKIMFGSTHNPIKKVAGALLQFAITSFVGKKVEKTVEKIEHNEFPVQD